MKQALAQAWYAGSPAVKLLYPVSLLFGHLARRRREKLLSQGPWQASVPVIVVGNITVGGTGKTPLCQLLAKYFTALGYKVALVTRGYGGKTTQTPLLVTPTTEAAVCGDEALLLAQSTQCPVIVDADRVRAVQYAETHHQPDLIISDDGLQHYALGRTVEIAVIDGERGLGNGLLLPAGPLREPAARLREVDFVVSNGALAQPLDLPVIHTMTLQPTHLVNVLSGEKQDIANLLKRQGAAPMHAVAGIGNPARFFATMRGLGFVIMPHAFADHHAFTISDLTFGDQSPVVMTAKDAVKCQRFARDNWWSLAVEGSVPQLLDNLLTLLQARQSRTPGAGLVADQVPR